MSDLSKALPCPFCLSDDGISISSVYSVDDVRYYSRDIECGYCECKMTAQIGWSEYLDLNSLANDTLTRLAVEKWNKRVEPKPVAWLCEDQYFKGERSVWFRESRVNALRDRPQDWKITPLYAGIPD